MKPFTNIPKMFQKQSFFVKCLIVFAIFGLVVFVMYRFKMQPMPAFEGFSNITPTKVHYYFMDGCGHCENFSPIWDEFVSSYKGDVKFQKINMKDAEEDMKKYNIEGFPTVVMIDDKDQFEHYEGERTIDGLQSIFG